MPDEIELLPVSVLRDINKLKTEILGGKTESLNVEETLIALSVSTKTNPVANKCIKMLKELRGCEMHATHLLSNGDESGLRKLGLNVTSDAQPSIKYIS